jgi:hypothetical protein
MIPKFVTIDGLKILVEVQRGALILWCERELDALTTLINLFTGVRPGERVDRFEFSNTTFENFRRRIPYNSEGFWTCKFELDEIEPSGDVGAFRKRWESLNGQELKEPVWFCINDWNRAEVYLVETTFMKMINFACSSFKCGAPVRGRNLKQYRSPIRARDD